MCRGGHSQFITKISKCNIIKSIMEAVADPVRPTLATRYILRMIIFREQLGVYGKTTIATIHGMYLCVSCIATINKLKKVF